MRYTLAVILLVVVALTATQVPADTATRPAERFGAAPDELGPLGGGAGYRRIIDKGDVRVATIDELLKALKDARVGQVIYIDDKAQLDFSVRVVVEKLVVEIPGGVTLAGGRGRNGSEGALLFSDVLDTRPLIRVTGPNVRITGLRLRGPDVRARLDELARVYNEMGREAYYRFPVSDGVISAQPGLEVDNCELSGWSHAAIFLQEGARDARVHHNYIHHCQRRGLGYGVCLDATSAVIESNIFDYYRHAIAATGRPGTRYEARNNLVLANAVSHAFDMHGGGDRKDGTTIAGDWISIHHNTFQVSDQVGIKVRGRPIEGGEVHHNVFLHTDLKDIYRQSSGDNVRVYRNQYGHDREIRD
ncbi:MAG TPA: right-handed parallel beta-helix repeat-containing protein [Phycisphaerae bacterium]|nr:right-handed parallel beta-helix repeat-containing protein [Phycisphaerae bacterium]